MNLNLSDKTVFVSGSGRGIGLAIAKSFLSEGANVVISDIDSDRICKTKITLEKEFDKNRILSVSGDLTDESQLPSILSEVENRFGSLDVLVANVGFSSGKPGIESDGDDWQKFFNLNIFGAERLTRTAYPMLKKSRGNIIYIASIAGMEVLGAPVPYSAAKSALIAMMRNFSKTLAKDGIRVNSISPGNVYFEGGVWDRKLKENRSKTLEIIKQVCPLNRFCKPEEIGDLAVFLASEKASFINGSNVVIDGGQVSGFTF